MVLALVGKDVVIILPVLRDDWQGVVFHSAFRILHGFSARKFVSEPEMACGKKDEASAFGFEKCLNKKRLLARGMKYCFNNMYI